MPFKLIGLSETFEHKIALHPGEQTFGRNQLSSSCKDNRISRKHGLLQVDTKSIVLKAIHKNPCFFGKKGSEQFELLHQNDSVTLFSGDRFGLLQDAHWFEILYMPDDEDNIETTSKVDEHQVQNGTGQNEINLEVTVKNETTDSNSSSDDQALSRAHTEFPPLHKDPSCSTHNKEASDVHNETEETRKETSDVPNETEEIRKEASEVPNETDEIRNEASKVPDETEGNENEPSEVSHEDNVNQGNRNISTPQLKRSYDVDGDNEAKKAKLEPEVQKVADEAKPGSSNQAGASNASDGGASSPKPPRERCMYGANCYRKNPQHHAQFSHPRDSDWGPGERGVCPYGMSCCKIDPRHWRDHEHPPGKLPPPRPGKQKRPTPPSPQGIIAGQRVRKTVQRNPDAFSDSEPDADPYGTDESDEWQPDSTSQEYSEEYI